VRLSAVWSSSAVLVFAVGFKLRCTCKSSVQLVLLHIVLQSSFICNHQEMYILLWGVPLVLFISPVSWGSDFELAPISCCNRPVWCDSHLAQELPLSFHHGITKAVSIGATSSALRSAHLMAVSMATASYSGFTCAAPVHFIVCVKVGSKQCIFCVHAEVAFHVWIEVQKGGNYFNCHAKPPRIACMYLSGVVHWFASLLVLLPSVGLLVYLSNRHAMAIGKSS